MKIGSLLKYYRTKANKTQFEVSQGICSVSHYSKIEKNSKEVNKETLDLIFERLGIKLMEIESQTEQIPILLDKLLTEIVYRQEEEVEETLKELNNYKDLMAYTDYIYKYELYKFRYYLFKNQMELAKKEFNFLQKHQKNFTTNEASLFDFFSMIYYSQLSDFETAEQYIEKLQKSNCINPQLSGEGNYAIGVIKSRTNVIEGITYFNKALNAYSVDFNQKRITHCLMSLGNLYAASKMVIEAKRYYLHALRMANDMKMYNLVLEIGVNIGYIMIQSGEFEEALLHLEKFSGCINKTSERYYIYIFILGYVHFHLGNMDLAKKYLQQVKTNIKNTSSLKSYSYMANLYLLIINGKEKELMYYYEEKVYPLVSTFDFMFMEEAKIHIKQIYIKNNKLKKAIQYF